MRQDVEGDTRTVLDGQLFYGLEVSKGLDGLGARSADEATLLRPLSRLGADTDFAKVVAGLTRAAPIAGPFSVQATVRGQTSFEKPLLRSEQLRAIYTLADLARQRAEGHSPAPSVRQIAAPPGTETDREKELRNALQSAKKRLKNLRNTLKQRNKRIAALEGRARPLTGSSAHVARTP